MHVMCVVGEASGDVLAAEAVAALREQVPSLRLSGIGGEALAGQGMQSLVPLDQVCVMGLLDVLPGVLRLRQAVRLLLNAAIADPPDALLLVDSLDFTHAVARRMRVALPNVRIVRYAAPKLWAWRPGRARKLRGIYHAIGALFPFEPAFFAQHQVPVIFVGHPAVHRITPTLEPRHTVLLLPGSRRSEIRRLLPLFLQAAAAFPDQPFIIPAVAACVPLIRQYTDLPIVTGPDARRALGSARAALAASGTVSLELALGGTPHVAAYKVDALSAFVARRLICVPYATLPNLLLNRAVVPELLQERCTVPLMIEHLRALLADPEPQTSAFSSLRTLLGADDPLTPAQRIAALLKN